MRMQDEGVKLGGKKDRIGGIEGRGTTGNCVGGRRTVVRQNRVIDRYTHDIATEKSCRCYSP